MIIDGAAPLDLITQRLHTWATRLAMQVYIKPTRWVPDQDLSLWGRVSDPPPVSGGRGITTSGR
jgi:hypothetical protein